MDTKSRNHKDHENAGTTKLTKITKEQTLGSLCPLWFKRRCDLSGSRETKMTRRRVAFAALLFSAFGTIPASAQVADLVLVNGKIVTVDSRSSVQEAIAVRGGRIAAVGTTADVRKLAGPGTRVIDLQGRTVIPGLIDSHLHAIRAALSFSTEVNWIGVHTLKDAVERIRVAARTMKPGAWLIVAGGWNVQQFKENRRPTQAELLEAAPNNPVYVQLG